MDIQTQEVSSLNTMQSTCTAMQLPPLSFPSSTSLSAPQKPLLQLQEFTLFPHLPPELRIKIWTHCLPSPTLHTISLPTCSCPHSFPICPRQHAPRTLSSLPILLQINSEARRECLRRYIILHSKTGKGFHLAFDGERDSVYFCNGRGPENDFWGVEGKWPDCIGGWEEEEGKGIGNLVIDEAVLERRDYVMFPEKALGMQSLTVLLMPWSSSPGSGGALVGRFELGEVEEEEDEGEKEWRLKRLRLLEWMEEMRVKFGLERTPVFKVAQWDACLNVGGGFCNGQGQWRLVETGLWVHWEYNSERKELK